MPQQLLQSIEQLRAELQQPQAPDTETKAELLRVLLGLENALADEGQLVVDQHQSLIDQLKESLWQFEKEHPTLTVVVGRVLDNLSRMGI